MKNWAPLLGAFFVLKTEKNYLLKKSKILFNITN